MGHRRRRVLRSLALAGASGGAACLSPPRDSDASSGAWTGRPGGTDGLAVGVERVADGLTSPTQLVTEPGSGALYAVDQTGPVHRVGPDGLEPAPYLDYRDRILVSPERGLLGMAFHPAYPDDQRLFLRYSAPRREGTPADYSHTEVLVELEAPPDAPYPRVETERTLVEFPSPTIYHQAGTIIFGPDGYLYVAMGEGTEEQFAQDVESNLLGGIHRIDVDRSTEDRPYGIPDDNPLVGTAGRPEYFAWGFRNPWRMSFNDGELIAGDVGSYRWEEVDVVRKGGNYGWPYREGAHCTGWRDSAGDGQLCGVDPDAVPGGEFVDPVVEFPRGNEGELAGRAVIAGYVYDREAIPDLRGRYVFSNYTTSLETPSGELFVSDPSGGRPWPTEVATIANSPDGKLNRVVNSMGRDAAGRLYVLTVGIPDKGDRFAHGAGEVLRLVPPSEATEPLRPPSGAR